MKKAIAVLAAVVMVIGFYGVASADNLTATAGVEDVSANAYNVFNTPSETKNTGIGYRGFAEQGGVPIPGVPGYFGPVIKGSRYQSVESMTEYTDTFGIDQLNKMAKEDGLNALGSKVIVTPLVDKVAKEDRANEIKVTLVKPAGAVLKAYITVRATSSGTVSPEIMAEAMLAARALGADAIHVSAQGAEIVLKSFGWGVGLVTTRATISSNESTGSVSSGGTGISGASAGYQDRPWIQLFAIDMVN